MKKIISILMASLSVGCAAESSRTGDRQAAVIQPRPARTSAALAFDPPIARAEAAPDLSRDSRGGAALVGFEEPATSSYNVFTYNRQASNYDSYYDKEAITEQVGVTHR